MSRSRGKIVASSLAVFALAGCGGGSDDPPAAAADSTPAANADDAPAEAPAATDTTDAPASGGGGGGLGMGAETWAKQLKVALRAAEYTVDGNTVTLILEDGAMADGESDCGVAAATAGTNVSVIITYPDGDVSC